MGRDDEAWPIVGAAIVVVLVLAVTVQATVGWGDVGASWVQAVGSVLAIVVALIAPYAHARALSRAERTKQLEMLKAVIGQARELSEDAVEATTSSNSMIGYSEFVYSRVAFKRMATLLDRLPHHMVEPPCLIEHLLITQTAMEQMPSTVEWISNAMAEMTSDPDDGIEALKDANRRVIAAHSAIVEALQPFGPRR